MKKYILIAGLNGAGKSTLYQTSDLLKAMERVNMDEIVRTFGDWRNFSDVTKASIESFEHLNLVKEMCDLVVLYDNTETFNRFAIYKNGNLYILNDKVQMWFEKYIK